MDTVHKIGRRKTAVARIYLTEGKGNITVNNKDYTNYFSTGTLQSSKYRTAVSELNQPIFLSGV